MNELNLPWEVVEINPWDVIIMDTKGHTLGVFENVHKEAAETVVKTMNDVYLPEYDMPQYMLNYVHAELESYGWDDWNVLVHRLSEIDPEIINDWYNRINKAGEYSADARSDEVGDVLIEFEDLLEDKDN